MFHIRHTPLVSTMSDRRSGIVGLLLAALLLHSASAAILEAATTRDKFVVASPLIVALACRDGVALLAAHTSDTPLLYDDDDDEDDNDDDGTFFRDLPGTFCGPFRLQTVGGGNGRSATMLTAGWRADAARLVNSARAIDREYREALGDSSTPYTLASDLSRYMAIHAGNDGLRALSCAVLLAFGTNNAGDGSERPPPGGDRLWLVDATGTYPVRALCIGGGLTTEPKNSSNGDASVVGMVPTADIVNQKLVDWLNAASRTPRRERSQPYFDVTAEEGLRKVLELLAGKEKISDDTDKDDNALGQALLQRGTRLELGIVGSSRLVRKRVRDIWGRRSRQPID